MVPVILHQGSLWIVDMEYVMGPAPNFRAWRIDTSTYAAVYFNIKQMRNLKTVGRISSEALIILKCTCTLHIDIDRSYEPLSVKTSEPVLVQKPKTKRKRRTNAKKANRHKATTNK